MLSVLYYLHLDKIASVAAVVPSRCEKETVAVDVKSREKSIKVGHQFPSPLRSSIACRMVIRNCLKYFVKKIHKLLYMSGLLSRNISRFRHLKNDSKDEKRRRRGDKNCQLNNLCLAICLLPEMDSGNMTVDMGVMIEGVAAAVCGESES